VKIKLEQKPIIPERIYSDKELQELDDELQAYRVEYTLKDGTVIKPISFFKYHNAQGSVINQRVVPEKYEQVEQKLDQYHRWLERKKYGREKNMERLVEQAKQELDMRMGEEILADDIPF
jgi:hypothetical protein